MFTSHASALLDTNIEGHKRGIDGFWDKTKDLSFSSSPKLQSIEIVVVTGDTVVIQTSECNTDRKESNAKLPKGTDAAGDNTKTARTGCNNEISSAADDCDATNNNITHPFNTNDNFLWELTGIIKAMERYIETKTQADFTRNQSRIRFDSGFVEAGGARMKITLSIIDSTTGFRALCQKWSRESMLLATALNGGNISPKLSFRLPETTNFDACRLTFVAQYKTMPFRLDSFQARKLCMDLELLARADLEVIKLVPVPSIDASLLYGVAIGLKAAPEDNEDRYHEKTQLVHSLFQQLATRDSAILIRSRAAKKKGFRDGITADDGLFHSSEESQCFLLMPEFVLSQDGPASLKSGVLHRMADVDHMLEETNAVDMNSPSHALYGSGKDDHSSMRIENPYYEYIETSLECLDCSPLNPWLQGDGLSSSTNANTLSVPDGTTQDPGNQETASRIVTGYRTSNSMDDEQESVAVPMGTSGKPKQPTIEDNSKDDTGRGKTFTDESGIDSMVKETILSRDASETDEENWENSTSLDANGINSKASAALGSSNSDSDDSSIEDGKNDETDFFATTPILQRPQRNEMMSPFKRENHHSCDSSTSLSSDDKDESDDHDGDSSSSSSESSSSTTTFGAFYYGSQQHSTK